jgi:uncharacterized membrane protein YqjE
MTSSSDRPLTSSFQNGGASASFLRLISAIAEHLLMLFSLASLEARELFTKTVSSLVLLVAILIALLIAYLSLLAAIIITAVIQFHFGWIIVLVALTLAHLLIAALLVICLRQKCTSSSFKVTTQEIQRDLEILAQTNLETLIPKQ